MSFLSPLFLFAVAAVGLPLIIHLLNLKRPQKVAFSTLAFFKELQKTTIRKIQIKRYLLLFIRLLAVACLALVLARPFLPPGVSTGNNNAPSLNVIVLDNSISMQRIGQDGPLFEQAKSIIETIEASSKESDRFIIQTTNGEATFNSIIGHSQLLRRTEEAAISDGGNYAIERMQTVSGILDESPYQNKHIFLITDGQQSQFSELGELDLSETISLTMFNLGDVAVQNTRILDVSTSSTMIGRGLPVTVSVEVKNDAAVPVSNQFITLEVDGRIAGQYSVSLPADGIQTYSFEVIPSQIGTLKGAVRIEGDEFTADNSYYFSLLVPESRSIVWVTDPNAAPTEISYTNLVLNASNQNDATLNTQRVTLNDIESVDYQNTEAIILDGLTSIPAFILPRLQEFVQNGGGLMFFPSEQGDIQNYNAFLQQFNVGQFQSVIGEFASFNSIAKGTQIQEDHPIFTELFETDGENPIRVANPDIFYYYKLRASNSPGGFDLISLNSGDPLIREKQFGEGRILISSIGTGVEWSNFSVKPLFAPFFYRSLMYVASSDAGGLLTHELGQPFSFSGDVDANTVRIIKNEEEIIPESRNTGLGTTISYDAENWQPGFVAINDEAKTIDVAVNFPRNESDFFSMDESTFESISQNARLVAVNEIDETNLNNEVIASGFGREIWNWFMWLGLVFLVIESLIAAFYKTESSNV
ncbi:MAG: BatA and WFA domain-containing protein [bacterium]|nr:BatA and WFA domain-containing protein [bacterium]